MKNLSAQKNPVKRMEKDSETWAQTTIQFYSTAHQTPGTLMTYFCFLHKWTCTRSFIWAVLSLASSRMLLSLCGRAPKSLSWTPTSVQSEALLTSHPLASAAWGLPGKQYKLPHQHPTRQRTQQGRRCKGAVQRRYKGAVQTKEPDFLSPGNSSSIKMQNLLPSSSSQGGGGRLYFNLTPSLLLDPRWVPGERLSLCLLTPEIFLQSTQVPEVLGFI